MFASETELYIAQIPVDVIRKNYSNTNIGLPIPHQLFADKVRDAQLDLAKILETMEIPQLQGDVELGVQPLMNKHKVKKYFKQSDPTEEVKPQVAQTPKELKEEVKEPQPTTTHRKDETNRKIQKTPPTRPRTARLAPLRHARPINNKS